MSFFIKSMIPQICLDWMSVCCEACTEPHIGCLLGRFELYKWLYECVLKWGTLWYLRFVWIELDWIVWVCVAWTCTKSHSGCLLGRFRLSKKLTKSPNYNLTSPFGVYRTNVASAFFKSWQCQTGRDFDHLHSEVIHEK